MDEIYQFKKHKVTSKQEHDPHSWQNMKGKEMLYLRRRWSEWLQNKYFKHFSLSHNVQKLFSSQKEREVSPFNWKLVNALAILFYIFSFVVSFVLDGGVLGLHVPIIFYLKNFCIYNFSFFCNPDVNFSLNPGILRRIFSDLRIASLQNENRGTKAIFVWLTWQLGHQHFLQYRKKHIYL